MLTKIAPSKPLRWQRIQYSPVSRQLDVLGATAQFMFSLWWDSVWGQNSPQRRRQRAQWLVRMLINLGPTFIKIGQALSTRADLLPVEYVEELAKLQDSVPAFSAEEAIALIEQELGKSLYTLYRDFNPIPLAAASLGQVHKARLHTGEEVVVKVQRPGLKRLFDLDVKTIHRILRFFQRTFPWTKKYDLEAIYYEFFSILYQEIDYKKEGQNADRFRENFKGYQHIVIPKIYWEYTTEKILTVEYAPGIKVDDRQALEACGINIKKLNQLGICCYLKQLLQDGFFQADPHPGNLAVSPDGSLIFYDFGMMSEVKALAKDQMVKTFFAVLRKDTDTVLTTLMAIGLIEPVPDMMPVRRLISFLLEKFTEKPVDIQAFNEIKAELYLMFEQQPFRLPAQMTFILKSLTTLDGIARSLDPEYNLVAAAQPFIKSVTLSKGRGNVVGELARQAKDFIQNRFNKPTPAEILIQRLERRIEDGELQIRVRSIESERTLKRIQITVKSLIYACFTGFTFLTGAVLLLGSFKGWAIFALSLSGITFIILIHSLITLSIRERLDRLAEK